MIDDNFDKEKELKRNEIKKRILEETDFEEIQKLYEEFDDILDDEMIEHIKKVISKKDILK